MLGYCFVENKKPIICFFSIIHKYNYFKLLKFFKFVFKNIYGYLFYQYFNYGIAAAPTSLFIIGQFGFDGFGEGGGYKTFNNRRFAIRYGEYIQNSIKIN